MTLIQGYDLPPAPLRTSSFSDPSFRFFVRHPHNIPLDIHSRANVITISRVDRRNTATARCLHTTLAERSPALSLAVNYDDILIRGRNVRLTMVGRASRTTREKHEKTRISLGSRIRSSSRRHNNHETRTGGTENSATRGQFHTDATAAAARPAPMYVHLSLFFRSRNDARVWSGRFRVVPYRKYGKRVYELT